MKNKILASITALCATLVLVGGFSVTAYAQTPTEETDDSGVIVETEPQPLTPEGNMTLVDDIDGDAAEDIVIVRYIYMGMLPNLLLHYNFRRKLCFHFSIYHWQINPLLVNFIDEKNCRNLHCL